VPDALVVPKRDAISPLRFHAALVAGLARVAANIGRGNLADKSERTPKALGKLFSGDSMDTDGRGLLNFLLADPTALDEVLSLYGFGLHRLKGEGGDDFATVADISSVQAELTEALRDGKRDHRETLRIADKARPAVARLHSIIAEADALKGLAA